MRQTLAALALALVAAGCEAQPKAMTGREFFDQFQKAEKATDADAVWNLLPEERRKNLISGAKAETKSTDVGDEKLGKDRLKRQLEGKPSALLNATFVEEKSQAEQVILVVEIPGAGKKEIALVREGGSLRVRWDDKTGI